MTGVCACGCGQATNRYRQSAPARNKRRGEYATFVAGHNTKNADGKTYRIRHLAGRPSNQVLEHRLIVEGVLGRQLHPKNEIHHVNGDRRDNRHANLVVCEDRAYHKLLHARARIVAAGGNPNTHRLCSRCRLVLPIESFGRSSKRQLSTQNACRACGNEYRYARRAA